MNYFFYNLFSVYHKTILPLLKQALIQKNRIQITDNGSAIYVILKYWNNVSSILYLISYN